MTLSERIDRACDRFERSWGIEPRREIEEVLLEFVPDEREQVLQEILPVEFELRRRAGEIPAVEEYLRRFPEAVGVVEIAFGLKEPEGTLPSIARGDSTCPSAPAASPGLADDASRTAIGNYEILRKLGQGGMGTVYQALHRRLKRVVALKVMRQSVTRDEATVRRFEREVEAIARLSHPNVVIAYDADVAEGVHFLVMEFVEGENLTEAVRRNGPFSSTRAVDCIIQAARGLNAVHSLGIIHRDIKPSNLLLSRDGVVKVVDLGLARLHEAAEELSELTDTGAILGTIDYMAPEQAASTKSADKRSDIYSLGCTLYFLLTGRIPFPGGSHVERLLAHREAPRPRIADTLAVPDGLQAIFEKMTAKSPADRYQSLDDVLRDLFPFSGQSETECELANSQVASLNQPVVTRIDPSARATPQPRASRGYVPVVVVACAVLALAGLAGGGWALFSLSQANPRASNDTKSVPAASVPPDAPPARPTHVAAGPFHERWLQTFATEPQEILFAGRKGRGSWRLDEDLRALTIDSNELRLVQLGRLRGDEDFDIQFEIESQGWTGERGLLFGYRILEIEKRDDACFQMISLNAANAPDGRRFINIRRMQAAIDSRTGYAYSHYTISAQVEVIPTRAALFALKLRGGTAVELSFDGTSCPSLISDEVNAHFGPEDYAGPWGIYNEYGVTWFSNPRCQQGK